jgi:three-Cys-motif partner protein
VLTAEDFFRIPAGRSLAKSEIVSKYFDAWAKIVGSRADDIAYVDLFCGPGTYDDGSESTPILVLKKAAKHERVCRQLRSFFNDVDATFADALWRNIETLPERRLLNHDPEVSSEPVVDGTLDRYRERLGDIPALLFLDPWGYKGLSAEEIERFISTWGSECLFFFNYRRVNAALSNEKLAGPVAALFGEETARTLTQDLEGLPPDDRKALILKTLRDSLTRTYGEYVSWFRLVGSNSGSDYYLVHVTKSSKGCSVVRDVMAKASSSRDASGVPSFEYNPETQLNLFRLGESLEDLEQSIMDGFEGQSVTIHELFELDSHRRNHPIRDYQEAVKRLESDGWVRCNPDASARPRGTIAQSTVVTFIPRESGCDNG